MSQDITSLIEFFNNEFKIDPLFKAIEAITENSPWHRERNIGIHTEMVFQNFLSRCHIHTPLQALLGGFATIFHDVGKPNAMEERYNEERGYYYRFGGHELISARLWEDWAVRNWKTLVSRFNFSPEHIFHVGFMIEQHLPWEIKKEEKLKKLALTLITNSTDNVFKNVILSDTYGRISDNVSIKRANSEKWCIEFANEVLSLVNHPILGEIENLQNKPVLFVPIGASGSGKSTIYESMNKILRLKTFSLDRMRLELYGDDYEIAFATSTKDKNFRNICNNHYRDLLREKKDLYLDNTNTSKKNRAFYITEARNRGYFIHALLLPVDLQTIINRQHIRQDKTIPTEAVVRQYMNINLPKIGEFDRISVIDSNLK